MKRILIFSPTGGDRLAESLRDSFINLGHEAELYLEDNYRHPYLFLFKISAKLGLLKRAVLFWEKYKEANGSAYERKILSWKPDLIFMYNFNSISSRLLRKIRDKYKIPTAYWVFADPLAGDQLSAYYFDHLIDCSHIFFINSSAMPSLQLFSKAQFHFLPVAADHNLYKPLHFKKDIDLVMVGNFSSISTSTITKAYLLDKLCESGFRVSAAGAGLKALVNNIHFPYLKKLHVINDQFLSVEEINELYNRAKIILAPEHPRDKDSPSPRVFEAALSGTLPLADFQRDSEKLVKEMDIIFRSVDQLIEKARFYLKNEQERERLAQKIHQLALAEHTVQKRAQTILLKVFES
jgi:spore maturation protein CgeB